MNLISFYIIMASVWIATTKWVDSNNKSKTK